MAAADQAAARTAQERDEFEGAIYRLRGLAEQLATEVETAELLPILQLAEDWLYGEEADTAEASAFTAQRLRLTELCAELSAREREHRGRLDAVERFGNQLDRLARFHGGPKPKPSAEGAPANPAAKDWLAPKQLEFAHGVLRSNGECLVQNCLSNYREVSPKVASQLPIPASAVTAKAVQLETAVAAIVGALFLMFMLTASLLLLLPLLPPRCRSWLILAGGRAQRKRSWLPRRRGGGSRACSAENDLAERGLFFPPLLE